MPIKHENRKLYPKDWNDIRAEVLERDGHKCKWCAALNHEMLFTNTRAAYIVLTIAHLDHDPTNNGEPGNRPNLAALCQKCHNGHDAKMRAGHARQTRRSKVAVKELF
jgi:5-methylcytosine-specific restriction endonuclease McrA